MLSLKLTSGEYYVKRAVALAGDVVELADGVLYVNGQPEAGDYVHGQTFPEDGSVTYPYTVDENCVFVVGDNRGISGILKRQRAAGGEKTLHPRPFAIL